MSAARNIVFLQRGGLQDLPQTRFGEILDGLELTERLTAARSIFVKVNLCAGSVQPPETGVNVSAGLAMGLVQRLRGLNRRAAIFIGDSDSVGFGFAHDKFAFLGYHEIPREQADVELVDLTRTPYRKIQTDSGFLRTFMLPEIALTADFVISLSKIKTHNIVRVTGAMKNHFGTLPHQFKNVYHPFLHRVIVDVNRSLTTDLSIVDGNPAMEGNGPVRGKPKQMNLTIFGDNPVATDAVMAATMRISPQRVKYLRLAAKEGLGEIDPERMQLLGEDLEAVSSRFEFVSPKKRLIMSASLTLQGLGERIKQLGHYAHYADALSDVRRVARYLRRRAQTPPRRGGR